MHFVHITRKQMMSHLLAFWVDTLRTDASISRAASYGSLCLTLTLESKTKSHSSRSRWFIASAATHHPALGGSVGYAGASHRFVTSPQTRKSSA